MCRNGYIYIYITAIQWKPKEAKILLFHWKPKEAKIGRFCNAKKMKPR